MWFRISFWEELSLFPHLSIQPYNFLLSLVYLNMRSVCIMMISDFQTLKEFV